MNLKGIFGVMGAGRVKTTLITEPRRKNQPIKADNAEHNKGKRIAGHISL